MSTIPPAKISGLTFNGKAYRLFGGAFPGREYDERLVGRPHARRIPRRLNKVTTLDAVMEVIQDGDTISYPHYYRTGDKGLEGIVAKLREHGKKDIKALRQRAFRHTDPWLSDAIRDGVIGGLYGNIYRKMGDHVVAGELLPWVSVGFSTAAGAQVAQRRGACQSGLRAGADRRYLRQRQRQPGQAGAVVRAGRAVHR